MALFKESKNTFQPDMMELHTFNTQTNNEELFPARPTPTHI